MVGVVPVGAPLPDIAGQIERAIGACAFGEGTDRRKTRVAVFCAPVIGAFRVEGRTPGPEAGIVATGTFLPFGFGGQAPAPPSAVGLCVVPVDIDRGMFGNGR